ncbi:uncharacterized protein LOC112271669 [Brachypodium distachyon]|uniref:uncharacterized protein LOC112271669 n=1 Tax=Brachypodium distachyon TaxID=15368 RepID=UPI000D0CE723|nr:uncharacterized protein LOC112271669 [Brachypodium distachyon]|eukprot:XP_024317181.1 uncharacterized protein LOC112271669 [Brachypodium distachyon]
MAFIWLGGWHGYGQPARKHIPLRCWLSKSQKFGRTRTQRKRTCDFAKLRYVDNKGDEPYLNKTLEHYNEMVTIYGNGMATGDYAKGSSEPLATDFVDVEDDEPANANATPPPNEEVTHSYNVGESSASRPSKRTKTTQYEEQGLGPTLVAVVIEKNVSNDNTPEGLWDNMKTLPTFGRDFLAQYYAYLVENLRIARAFHTLDHDEKMVWVARYVRNNIPSHPEANPHE